MNIPSADILELELDRFEGARVKALLDRDVPALSALLCDDLTFTHTTGVVDDKQAVLASIETGFARYLTIERQSWVARFVGNVAVANSRLRNEVQIAGRETPNIVLAQVTMTWLRRAEHWRLWAYQATRVDS